MWLIRNTIVVLGVTGLAGFFGVMTFGKALLAALPAGPPTSAEASVAGCVCPLAAFSALGFGLAALGWRQMAIRAVEISEDTVVLGGVDSLFIQALRRQETSTGRGVALKQAVRQPHDLRQPPDTLAGSRWLGVILMVLGVASFILPLFGLQLEIVARWGANATVVGDVMAVVGLLVFLGSFRRRSQSSEPPASLPAAHHEGGATAGQHGDQTGIVTDRGSTPPSDDVTKAP
jgi:hypothetical protein